MAGEKINPLKLIATLAIDYLRWAALSPLVTIWAFGVAMLFLPTVYAGLSRLLSMPKPVQLEWWHAHAEEATVLASSFREEEAIYKGGQVYVPPGVPLEDVNPRPAPSCGRGTSGNSSVSCCTFRAAPQRS